MRLSRLFSILALSLAVTAPALAQRPTPDSAPARREALEQRVRQRMAVVVKQRVGLSDEQMRRLGEVNREIETQRRLLHEQERDVRIGLRGEVMRGDSANQERVSRYLDQLIDLQRRRIDLISREQRELAGFMTPVQRAKYLAMQDQMRRRVEEMRRPGGRAGQRRGPPMPPR